MSNTTFHFLLAAALCLFLLYIHSQKPEQPEALAAEYKAMFEQVK